MRLYIEYRGDSIEIPRGETLVGRDVGCALRFNDPAVSRRHLRFIRRHDDAFVEDLSSSNGTLLNGRLVKSAVRLRDGDIILVGSRVLVARMAMSDDVDLPVTLHPDNNVDDASGTDIDLAGRAPTGMIKRVPEPPAVDQRCPRCSAGVAANEVACGSCGYRWADFRPSTPTMPPFLAPQKTAARRADRQPTSLRLIYISSELEIEAMTRDLSHNGVFITTEILDPIGTHCRLTLLIDGGPPLEVSGIVRRVVDKAPDGGVGLGIELVELTDSDHKWIDLVLARDDRADGGIQPT